MLSDKIVSRVFTAREFTKMLTHKEETGGIVIRIVHPAFGVCYEVRYLPILVEEK